MHTTASASVVRALQLADLSELALAHVGQHVVRRSDDLTPVLPTPDHSPAGWCGEADRARSRPREHRETRDGERGADGIRPSMRKRGRDDRARGERVGRPRSPERSARAHDRAPHASRAAEAMRSVGRGSLHRRSACCAATPNSALGATGVRMRRSVDRPTSRPDGPPSGSMMKRAIPTCASRSSCASVSRRSLSAPADVHTNSRLVAVARPVSAACPSAARQVGEPSSSRTRRCASRRSSSRSEHRCRSVARRAPGT